MKSQQCPRRKNEKGSIYIKIKMRFPTFLTFTLNNVTLQDEINRLSFIYNYIQMYMCIKLWSPNEIAVHGYNMV